MRHVVNQSDWHEPACRVWRSVMRSLSGNLSTHIHTTLTYKWLSWARRADQRTQSTRWGKLLDAWWRSVDALLGYSDTTVELAVWQTVRQIHRQPVAVGGDGIDYGMASSPPRQQYCTVRYCTRWTWWLRTSTRRQTQGQSSSGHWCRTPLRKRACLAEYEKQRQW